MPSEDAYTARPEQDSWLPVDAETSSVTIRDVDVQDGRGSFRLLGKLSPPDSDVMTCRWSVTEGAIVLLPGHGTFVVTRTDPPEGLMMTVHVESFGSAATAHADQL